MVPIQKEKSVEVLRFYTTNLIGEVEALRRENNRLRGMIDGAKKAEFPDLADQLSRLRVKYFGSGRESVDKDITRPVGHPDQSLLLHGTRPVEVKSDEQSKPRKIPTQIEFYAMTEEELLQEASARGIAPSEVPQWEAIPGLCVESKEITVQERTFIELIHRRQKYRLKDEFNSTDKEVLVTAKGPAKVLPGCRYSLDFAISVVSDKYDFHLPLERQRRQMEVSGLEVEVKTLYSLSRAVAEKLERWIVPEIRKDILGEFCAVHIDETPWGLQGGSGGHMWTLSNRTGAVYRFEPTRSGKIAEELLKNYRGAALSDGFAGYNRVRKISAIRLGHCWSHARREFFERLGDFPAEVKTAIEMIDELFRIERACKTFEELRSARKTQSIPQLEKLRKWMLSTRTKFLPGHGITKAIDYCLKLWPGLTLFSKDLTLPLSNNDAERALRHVVMGRKNFLGSKSIDGADTAATLYTVIETAKRTGLDPKKYLRYALTEIWIGNKPLSPLRLAIQLGASAPLTPPSKDDWKI
jgi:transposase